MTTLICNGHSHWKFVLAHPVLTLLVVLQGEPGPAGDRGLAGHRGANGQKVAVSSFPVARLRFKQRAKRTDNMTQ